MAGGLEGEYFVGKDIERFRGLMKLAYPMEHGIGMGLQYISPLTPLHSVHKMRVHQPMICAVEDWADMEKVWQHLYAKELHIHSEEVC
jgi:centractin